MTSLMRISEAAGMALHTVEHLARHPERNVTTQEAAEVFGVSEHHLAKVHQRLARAGLLQAVRGPGGGFQLARPANRITLMEVYEAVDGPMATYRCLLGRPQCRRENCLLGTLTDQVNGLVLGFFKQHTVADLVV